MVTELETYGKRLLTEVFDRAETEGVAQADAFAMRTLDLLEESGYVANHTVTWFESKARGVQIHGFGYSDDETILELYTTSFAYQATSLTKNEMERYFRQALALLRRLEQIKGDHDRHTAIHQMCEGVLRVLDGGSVDRVRIFLMTNRTSVARTMPAPPVWGGVPVEYHLWDLPKLHRQELSGDLGEPISVTFEPPLDCLAARKNESHSVVLAVIPGLKLAQLYDEYRTRLLQLNVRAFLQTRGKVNKGIRLTALNEPDWFLAYNNGVTATASEADFVLDASGNARAIRSLTGLQIVNGGQTTATLHHVLRRDGNALAGVDVQMKLTLVSPDALDAVVPRISAYSNTQNRVSLVDFSSNDRFHVDFEKVSRAVWVPPRAGALTQTRWFYVRTRGAYEAELDKNVTPAAKRRFREANPKSQSFTKTDLAKYFNAWSGLPHLVSRGAQKNFASFQERAAEDMPIVDADFCRRLIAMKILFDAVDGVARTLGAGSNKSAVTAYTMALLCEATNRRIDLDRVWRDQAVSHVLREAIEDLCARVMKVVVKDGVHVIEWAKKIECWTEVSSISWQIPSALVDELRAEPLDVDRDDQEAQRERLARFKEIEPDEWEALRDWAQETGLLDLHEQQLAGAVGGSLESGSELAPSRVRRALEVFEKARSAGFDPGPE